MSIHAPASLVVASVCHFTLSATSSRGYQSARGHQFEIHRAKIDLWLVTNAITANIGSRKARLTTAGQLLKPLSSVVSRRTSATHGSDCAKRRLPLASSEFTLPITRSCSLGKPVTSLCVRSRNTSNCAYSWDGGSKLPQVRRVDHASKSKFYHLIRIAHRDEVEPPITNWLQEAYELSNEVSRAGVSKSPRGVEDKPASRQRNDVQAPLDQRDRLGMRIRLPKPCDQGKNPEPEEPKQPE